MPNFRWQDVLNRALRDRFDPNVVGAAAWQALVDALEQMRFYPSADACLERFDDFLQAASGARPPAPGECRVFVSHRRSPADTAYAARIAWLAARAGYGYWLDIHDPTLHFIGGSVIPSPAREVLIAAIIEIALLNATHVVAVMTKASAGSKWIPYEFGRAKQRLVRSRYAATWLHRMVTEADCGEYVHLGVLTRREPDLTGWLARTKDTCCPGLATWPNGDREPTALPTELVD